MKKIRNGRNPRYQEALNLAQENNVLAEKQTDHNFQTVLNLANIDSEIPRNDRLTDAYIKLAGRYSDMVNLIRTREDRIDLLERELKNCDPEHWLFAEEDSEDNAAEAEDEPEPDQEFDFGDDFKQYELKTRKPN